MNKNLPKAKGLRTGLQAFGGIVIAFIAGLAAVVWAVDGVPEAVTSYLLDNATEWAISLGVSGGLISGVISFVQNMMEDER